MDGITLGVKPAPIKSQALSFAVLAGFKPAMSYTLRETARYTGYTEKALRQEVAAGRLKSCVKAGNVRGLRFKVTEVDRWMATC